MQNSNITIGHGTKFNGSKNIVCDKYTKVKIGKYCAIADKLHIITLNHDYNYTALQGFFYKKMWNGFHPGELLPYNRARTKGGVKIGNDVWLGDSVLILSGVTIGDGCCIGARSVVTKNMPPYTICAGTPCKVVKNRYNPDMKKFLLKTKWWDWSEQKIRKNKAFFYSNLNQTNVENIKKLIR